MKKQMRTIRHNIHQCKSELNLGWPSYKRFRCTFNKGHQGLHHNGERTWTTEGLYG